MKDRKKHIFLTGFMGAGKSTVGSALAEILSLPCHDLDDIIVKKEGRSIADIFTSDGEAYFRDCESASLKQLQTRTSSVCATGGGIIERAENRSLMREMGHVVYLDPSWDDLKERLAVSEGRPLADSGQGWDEIFQRWQRRVPLYEEAEITIKTSGLEPLAIAQRIVSLLEMER